MTLSSNVPKMINNDRIFGQTVLLSHCPFTSRLWYRLSQPSLTSQCGETCHSPCWGLEIAPCFVWKGSEEWDWVLGRCYGTGGTRERGHSRPVHTSILAPFLSLFLVIVVSQLATHVHLHKQCTSAVRRWQGKIYFFSNCLLSFGLFHFSFLFILKKHTGEWLTMVAGEWLNSFLCSLTRTEAVMREKCLCV